MIAAFVSPTEDDWRLSFVKLDYSIETTPLGFIVERPQLTPALRYSYLVGANENCHTAQKQFISLLENDVADPAIETLEAAFGVERVTTEFFEQYHQLFERSRDALTEFLRGAPSVQETFEKLGVTADDFAKKLLGQVVFLYFLQKKGWFGVERGKPWGAGQRNFMRHLFKHRERYGRSAVTQARPANFFNDILEPLFYEALASPRLDVDHYYSHFDCRIPFLNGGLFEPLYGYKWVETDVLLPDSLFSNDLPTREGDVGTGILDVFDRYNFTVNESEPLEREVAVDPEMLGKVFENLLPENLRHASGTYYTPRAIVQYMCRQALLHCLSAQAPAVPPEQITAFLHAAERFADFEATDTKAHSDKRLPDVSRLKIRLARIALKAAVPHGKSMGQSVSEILPEHLSVRHGADIGTAELRGHVSVDESVEPHCVPSKASGSSTHEKLSARFNGTAERDAKDQECRGFLTGNNYFSVEDAAQRTQRDEPHAFLEVRDALAWLKQVQLVAVVVKPAPKITRFHDHAIMSRIRVSRGAM